MRYRTVQWGLIKALPWVAAIVVCAVAYLLLWAVNSKPDAWSEGGLSKDLVVRVAGSLFASALFFIVIQVLLALKSAPKDAEHAYFSDLYLEHGIKNIFVHRGGEEALAAYAGALRGASKRVWAVGLSCRRFLTHQYADLGAALIRNPASIEIKVFFADPNCRLKTAGQERSILDVHYSLGERTDAVVDWQKAI